MPSYLCKQSGCTNTVSKPNAYCQKHRHLEQHEACIKEENEQKRKKFYNSKAWQRMRQRVLADQDHVCNACKDALATEVHHKVSLSVDWSRRLDKTNLEALCKACHAKMTASSW